MHLCTLHNHYPSSSSFDLTCVNELKRGELTADVQIDSMCI